MIEIWKPIKNYEELYEVSNFGNIHSFYHRWGKRKKPLLLKGSTAGKGYLMIALHKNKIKEYKKIHHLVAETFIPNFNNKPEINHINGIKIDNRVANIEWCTRGENIKHSYKMGFRNAKGENHPYHKLTEKQIRIIKYALKIGTQQRILAKMCNVSKSTIGAIKNNRNWKFVII